MELKKIAAQRITKANIFWSNERNKKRGIDNDYRQEMYNTIKNMTLTDLKKFFDKNIEGGDYTILLIGNKKDIDFENLKKLGAIKELSPEFLFNYETATPQS